MCVKIITFSLTGDLGDQWKKAWTPSKAPGTKMPVACHWLLYFGWWLSVSLFNKFALKLNPCVFSLHFESGELSNKSGVKSGEKSIKSGVFVIFEKWNKIIKKWSFCHFWKVEKNH